MTQSRLQSYKHSRAINISIADSVIISKLAILYVSRNAVNWQASNLISAPLFFIPQKEGKGSARAG
jgi:uncharacterized membrane protein